MQEWVVKRFSRNPVNKMWDAVRPKQSGQEEQGKTHGSPQTSLKTVVIAFIANVEMGAGRCGRHKSSETDRTALLHQKLM